MTEQTEKKYNKKVILPDADTVSDAENYEDLRVFDQFGQTVMLKTSQREEFQREVQEIDHTSCTSQPAGTKKDCTGQSSIGIVY